MASERPGKKLEQHDAQRRSEYFSTTFLLELSKSLVLDLSRPEEKVLLPLRRIKDRKKEQQEFIREIVPEAWHKVDIMVNTFLTDDLREKLHAPENIDHGIQHLNRVWQNFIVACVYTPEVMSLSKKDLRDFTIAGAIACLFHDHLQIDAEIKGGHGRVGAVFVAGAMELGRQHGLELTDKQISLATQSVYWHSYPEFAKRADMEIPLFAEILKDEAEGFRKEGSVLLWLERHLEKGWFNNYRLKELKSKKDRWLLELLIHRVAAADKRDSNAPPFLANIRTMMAKRKGVLRPFAAFDDLEYKDMIDRALTDKKYKPKSDDFKDDLLRIVYEIIRDYREGLEMSAFEATWLDVSLKRRLEYVEEFAIDMAEGSTRVVDRKYLEMSQKIIEEAEREGKISNPKAVAGQLTAHFEEIARGMSLSEEFLRRHLSLDQTDAGVISSLKMIMRQHQAAVKMFRSKSKMMRQDFGKKESPKFEKRKQWLIEMVERVIEDTAKKKKIWGLSSSKLPSIPSLPIFVVDFGID